MFYPDSFFNAPTAVDQSRFIAVGDHLFRVVMHPIYPEVHYKRHHTGAQPMIIVSFLSGVLVQWIYYKRKNTHEIDTFMFVDG